MVEGCGGGQLGRAAGVLSTVAAGAPQAHRPHVHGPPGAQRPAPAASMFSATASGFDRHGLGLAEAAQDHLLHAFAEPGLDPALQRSQLCF